MAGWRWVACCLGGVGLVACGPEPFVHDDLSGGVRTASAHWLIDATSELNVVVLVDNTERMEPLIDDWVEQLETFLRVLLGDVCVGSDSNGPSVSDERPDELGYCSGEGRWARTTQIDLRLGVLTTSLGGPGCADTPHENDGARFLPQVRPGLESHHPAGFLVWEKDAPRDQLPAFLEQVEAHVRAAGFGGCKYPAPLEVLRRFTREDASFSSNWEQAQLALQRAEFFWNRDELLVVGALTQDDCSLPRDLDLSGLEDVISDGSEADDRVACERLVLALSEDPRLRIQDLGWSYGVVYSDPDCRGGRCEVFRYSSAWAVPWSLVEYSTTAMPRLTESEWSRFYDIGAVGALSAHHVKIPRTQNHHMPVSLPLLSDLADAVPCRMALVQRLATSEALDCSTPGRRSPDDTLRELAWTRLRAREWCDTPDQPSCEEFSLCEVEQLTGSKRAECLQAQPTVTGFCSTEERLLSPGDDDHHLEFPAYLRLVSPPVRPLPSAQLMYWCQQDEE